MSLPGIRLEVLESENTGGGDGGGGETHVTGLSENAMSTSHQQHHKLSADKAGVDHNINSIVGATHAQQLLEGSEDSGTATNVAASDRMQRNKPVKWSVEEDRRLRDAVSKFDEARWKDIANLVETRNHVQCLQRWKKVLKPGLVKGQWSQEEDDRLVRVVERGFRNWGQVASFMEGRTSKQCRERWCHHLDPAVRKGGYTTEEDELIICLQGEVGNRWADIAKRLTGRTENAVKIRWKALNRRQRDARTKLAAMAATARASDAGGVGSPSSGDAKSTSLKTQRTDAKDGSRATAQAGGRATATSAAVARLSSKSAKRRNASLATASTGGESSSQESDCSDDRTASNSCRWQAPVTEAARAAALAAAAANAAMGKKPAAGRFVEATPASEPPPAKAKELAEHAPIPSASSSAHSAGKGAGDVKGERLHRLCAALRDVEAMDNLQETAEDDATVMTADTAPAETASADAAPHEVFPQRSPSPGSESYGHNSPVHGHRVISDSVVSEETPAATSRSDPWDTRCDKQRASPRPSKRLKMSDPATGGRSDTLSSPSPSPSPPRAVLPPEDLLASPTTAVLKPTSHPPPARSVVTSIEDSPLVATAAVAVAEKASRLSQASTEVATPRTATPPLDEHSENDTQPSPPVASAVAGNPWGVIVGPVSRSNPLLSTPVIAAAAADAVAQPWTTEGAISSPLGAGTDEWGRRVVPATAAQEDADRQAAQDRQVAAAAVASLFSFQGQVQPDLAAVQSDAPCSSAGAPLGSKRTRDRVTDISVVTTESSRTLESTPLIKKGRRSPSHSSSLAPPAEVAAISKSSGVAAAFTPASEAATMW